MIYLDMGVIDLRVVTVLCVDVSRMVNSQNLGVTVSRDWLLKRACLRRRGE